MCLAHAYYIVGPANIHSHQHHCYHTGQPWIHSILSKTLKMLYVNILYNQKILTFERKNLDLYFPGIHRVLNTIIFVSTLKAQGSMHAGNL